VTHPSAFWQKEGVKEVIIADEVRGLLVSPAAKALLYSVLDAKASRSDRAA